MVGFIVPVLADNPTAHSLVFVLLQYVSPQTMWTPVTLGSYAICWVLIITHFRVQWLSWVFATQERKKERNWSSDWIGFSPPKIKRRKSLSGYWKKQRKEEIMVVCYTHDCHPFVRNRWSKRLLLWLEIFTNMAIFVRNPTQKIPSDKSTIKSIKKKFNTAKARISKFGMVGSGLTKY